MAHPQTDKLVQKLVEVLEAGAVSEYVMIFRDPDSNVDILRYFGSPFWRMGVGMELIDSVKEERCREQAAEDAEGAE